MNGKSAHLLLLLLSMTISGVADAKDYVYLPQTAETVDHSTHSEGIFVREVQVRKQDTLSGLAKKLIGKGAYYPQILLFNRIKNPHLIHPGDIIKVPVAKKPVKQERSSKGLKEEPKSKGAKKVTLPRAEQPGAKPSTPTPVLAAPSSSAPEPEEQLQYDLAMATLRSGNCRDAIDRLDSFISRYPRSPLQADASLARADCYLKLSAP